MKFLVILFIVFSTISCNRETEKDADANDGDDGGETTQNMWTNTLDQSEDPTAVKIYKLFADRSGRLFAGTDSGIFRTVTMGDKWKHFLTGNIRILSFHETSNAIYAGSENNGVYVSNDGGVTWYSFGLLGQTVYSMTSHYDTLIVGTKNNGVFKINVDTDTWINIGLSDTTVYSLIEDYDRNLFAGTEKNGLLAYQGKLQWKKTKIASGAVYEILLLRDNSFYLSLWGQGLFKVSDKGNTVTGTGLKNPNYVQSIAADTSGHLFTTNFQVGVLASSNNAATWTALNNGLSGGDKQSIVIMSDGTLFVSEDPQQGTPSGIYKYSKTSYNYNK